MKVVELLLQGKKVWDINKRGYYWLDGDELMCTNINTGETERLRNVFANFLFREGEEYKELKTKYFWSFEGVLFELYKAPSFTIGCIDVKGCNERICTCCPLHNDDGSVPTSSGEIHKIKY